MSTSDTIQQDVDSDRLYDHCHENHGVPHHGCSECWWRARTASCQVCGRKIEHRDDRSTIEDIGDDDCTHEWLDGFDRELTTLEGLN